MPHFSRESPPADEYLKLRKANAARQQKLEELYGAEGDLPKRIT